MAKTIRMTMAQAVVHFMKKQMAVVDGQKVPIFGGVWAIFGHGNVAGMGEALYQVRDELPTYRAHNEQGMAHAAIAYAKASFRQRFMACTTSIGPGALNMVTAAGVAHANRLPVLFLPGDVFANRAPDPVLQQIEDFQDGTVSASDAFRPVTRYFDRITRPEQIIPFLNDYASLVIGAIHKYGGNVLKLIGDGILAIFKGPDLAAACSRALAAQTAMRHELAILNRRRAQQGDPQTSIYLSLHQGRVFYGNIGSRNRLDFTVVGPAVNEVSRICAVCKATGRDLILSGDFVSACAGDARERLTPLGEFSLRGVSEPMELFAMRAS